MLEKTYYCWDHNYRKNVFPPILLLGGTVLKMGIGVKSVLILRFLNIYMKLLLQTFIPSHTVTSKIPETVEIAFFLIMKNFEF